MATENEQEPPNQPAPAPAEAGSFTPEPTDPPSPATPAPAAGEGKTLSIPTSEIGRIKREAREKGRKEADEEYTKKLAKLAKFMGFNSLDEMEAADPEEWQKRRNVSAPASPSTPKEETPMATTKKTSTPTHSPDDRVTALQEKNRQLNRARAADQRRVKLLERESAAREAEHQLRIAATAAGVKDVDYALHLLKKDMAGKSIQELATFDENAYFSTTLRERIPHLYGTESVPATTGTTGETPAARSAATPPAGEGEGTRDVRQVPKEQYRAELKKLGLTDPSLGG